MKIIKNDIHFFNKDKIKNITYKISSGKRLPINSKYEEESSYKYIRVVDIINGKIKNKNLKCISKELHERLNNYIVKKGDLLLSNAGTIGSTCIVSEKENNYNLTENCLILKVNENNILSKYLYFYLTSKKGINDLEKITVKTTIPKLPIKNLKELIIFFPEIKQQEKIANVLSLQERQVEIIETLIEKLEKRNQCYAEKLLSGEKRIRKNEQGEIEFYDNTEWQEVSLNGKVVSIPQGWVVEKVGNIIIEFRKSKIKTGDAKKNQEGTYPFFNCSKKQTLTYDDYIVDDDVLFLNTGGIPAIHYYIGKVAYSTDSWALTTKNDLINKYLYYYIHTNINILNNYFQGAVIKHLNKKDFKNLEIFYPDLEVQKNIIDYIDNLSKEKETLEKLLIKEKLRFQWMLDNLLSGEYEIID